MGCYAILTIHANFSKTVKESVEVAFIRFAYDVEKSALAIENSELPDAYAEMLRKGY